jgi:hypothetical protein
MEGIFALNLIADGAGETWAKRLKLPKTGLFCFAYGGQTKYIEFTTTYRPMLAGARVGEAHFFRNPSV